MKKVVVSVLAGVACALLLSIPVSAADKAAAAPAKAPAVKPAQVRKAWPQETLSGKVAMVDPDQKLVVIRGADGVTYDMMVTAKTRIRSNDQAITLKALAQDRDKEVSVKFVPERRGDVARLIRIGG